MTREFRNITAPEAIEIAISEDGERVWINDEERCILRVCEIGSLLVDDMRGTIHLCPEQGEGRCGCCLKEPFELPRTDMLTLDESKVTCQGTE